MRNVGSDGSIILFKDTEGNRVVLMQNGTLIEQATTNATLGFPYVRYNSFFLPRSIFKDSECQAV